MNIQTNTVEENSLARDILWGAKQIGAFMGLFDENGEVDEKRTYWMLERGYIPAGKRGAIWTASRRRLRADHDRITQGVTEAPQPHISRRVSARPHPRRRQARAVEVSAR
jgi:hypothetical protein